MTIRIRLERSKPRGNGYNFMAKNPVACPLVLDTDRQSKSELANLAYLLDWNDHRTHRGIFRGHRVVLQA